jgi:hypothetical protein
MPFYKMLLNKPINLADIEAVDPHLFSSLRWMLSNDITEVIDTTFSVEHDSFGCLKVTNTNLILATVLLTTVYHGVEKCCTLFSS